MEGGENVECLECRWGSESCKVRMEEQVGPGCKGPHMPISSLPHMQCCSLKVQGIKSCRNRTPAAVEGGGKDKNDETLYLMWKPL